MPEISLKVVRKEGKDLVAPEEVPKVLYPGFNVHENVPAELMRLKLGQEMTAKIKVVEIEKREGKNARQSIGFDVLAVLNYPAKKGGQADGEEKEQEA